VKGLHADLAGGEEIENAVRCLHGTRISTVEMVEGAWQYAYRVQPSWLEEKTRSATDLRCQPFADSPLTFRRFRTPCLHAASHY
jgi:hypothetical protein